ncbi:MAG: hypothetical protein AAFX50_14160, partial [Acidobacteriota bacterium]
MIRRLRRRLSADEPFDRHAIFSRHRRRAEHFGTLVHVFYILQIYQVYQAFQKWSGRLESVPVDALWPASWLSGLASDHLVSLVTLAFAGGVVSACLAPTSRLARTLAFLGMLLYGAYDNSFGKIDHGFHAWLVVSFIFIALPEGRPRSRAARHDVLTLFTAAQASFLA